MLVGVAAIAASAGMGSSTARAADETASPAQSRAYVQLSPGLIAVPMGDDDLEDAFGVSYQWGLGAGGVFGIGGPGRNLALTVGFNFEHLVLAPDGGLEDFCDTDTIDCSYHNFRVAPEVRFGGGTERLFAYGTLSPGLGILYGQIEAEQGPFRIEEDDSDLGFDFGFGGGVQYVVWRGLSVGGEVGFNFGIYPGDDEDTDAPVEDADYGLYTFELKAVVGWWF